MKKTSESPTDLLGNEVVRQIMEAVHHIYSSKVKSGTVTSIEHKLRCRIEFIKTGRINIVYKIKGECNEKPFDLEVKIRKYVLDLPTQIFEEAFEQEEVSTPIGIEYMNDLPRYWRN